MFIFALLTAIFWGAADLFYKAGAEEKNKYSALKTVIAVGLIMGIHAGIYMLANKVDFTFLDVVKYLPVSALYIISMAIGYRGLRYLDLSVASPIQNASGALVLVLCLIFFQTALGALDLIGVILITVGIFVIGLIEKKEEAYAPLVDSDKKYRLSVLAILFPILYCIIDALGTFADAIYLDELQLISEDAALIAYELTFFVCAAACFVFLLVKKADFNFKSDKFKLGAAIFETAGQFFYVYAMAGNAVIAAPLVASYCIFSIIFSMIFLKERLSWRKWIAVGLVVASIVLLGISEGLAA